MLYSSTQRQYYYCYRKRSQASQQLRFQHEKEWEPGDAGGGIAACRAAVAPPPHPDKRPSAQHHERCRIVQDFSYSGVLSSSLCIRLRKSPLIQSRRSS